MHIGLIGGIGVAATLVYYQRLVSAIEALGGQPEITIVHAQAQDLVRNNAADDRESQAIIYATLIDRLKAAGCDCAAITSLGGHFCYEETVQRASLRLVSAVAPLDDYFASQGLSTVGLLGTRVVMPYTDMALAGTCTGIQREYFLNAGQRLSNDGADAIVLAGTDLNLAFDGQHTNYRVIDALDVHVGVLAKLGSGANTIDIS